MNEKENEKHICRYFAEPNKPDIYTCECGSRITINSLDDIQIEMQNGWQLDELPEGFSVEFVGQSMTFTQLELEERLKSAEDCLVFWQSQVDEYKRLLGFKEHQPDEWSEILDSEN